MRTPFKITFCVVLSSMLLLVVFAVTQEPKQSGMNIPAYNPSQESTFSGTIVEVKNYQCPVLGTPGAHIASVLSEVAVLDPRGPFTASIDVEGAQKLLRVNGFLFWE